MDKLKPSVQRWNSRSFFIFFVDHKLLIWDKADGERCCFGASGGLFLPHKHNGSIFPYRSLEVDGEDLIEVHRRLKGS